MERKWFNRNVFALDFLYVGVVFINSTFARVWFVKRIRWVRPFEQPQAWCYGLKAIIKLSRNFYFFKIRPLSESIMLPNVFIPLFESLQISENRLLSFSIDKELRNFFFSFLLRFTTRFLCFRKLCGPMSLLVRNPF